MSETPDPADVADASPVATASKKGPMIMTDILETAKTYAEEAKTRIQSAFAEANDKAKAAMEKSSKAFEEMGELTKGNLEAVVESSKIAAKGVESLGQEAAEFSRKSFEKTSATMKSFAAVKTPAEFFQLQSELLSATLDSFASEASKSSEAFLKLASDISTPISNRVSVVSEKMKSLAA
jgi:phasin family protein